MIKKIIFGITILLNIILSVVLVFTIIRSVNEITSNYDEDALTEVADSSVKTELERENFGYVGARTRPWRYGAQGQEGSEDYYKLGEYTDRLFFREFYEAAGDRHSVEESDKRLEELRTDLSGYENILDKMDESVKKAIKDQ